MDDQNTQQIQTTDQATCPKCGPITPIPFRSRPSCPTCYRPVATVPPRPEAPQPPLATHVDNTPTPVGKPADSVGSTTPNGSTPNFATYVASDLTLIDLPRETTGHPASIYIGSRAYWKLTVPVYVRLAQAIARRLTAAQTPTPSPAVWKGMAKSGASSVTAKEPPKTTRPAPISPEEAETIKEKLALAYGALIEGRPTAAGEVAAMMGSGGTVPDMPALPRVIEANW